MTFATWFLPPDQALPEGAPLALDGGSGAGAPEPSPASVRTAGPQGASGPGEAAAGLSRLDVSPDWMEALTAGLMRARPLLLARQVGSLADTLGRAGARFLDPGDPLRREALELLPVTSGLSAAMSEATLDGMAADWTPERLHGLLAAEFPDGPALDGFVAGRRDALRAVSAPLTTQVVSGSVPGVGATALLRSLLVKSPTLLKPGLGDVVLPVLLARAVAEEDPELAAAMAVVYWPGDALDVTTAAVAAAGTVVAYGSDHAVASLRDRAAVTSRFVAYHHRVSVGVVGRDALTADRVREVASEVAGTVAFFDQRGCVSPQVVYVEEGGSVDPLGFAEHVAGAMAQLEDHLPGGPPQPDEAAAVQQVRATAEILAAAGKAVWLRHGEGASWTVVLDSEDALDQACVARTVRLVPISDAMMVPERLRPMAAHLQTLGVAGCGEQLGPLANAMAEVGVTRITPFDRVAFPPPWWHHDGEGPLTALVKWVELESPR